MNPAVVASVRTNSPKAAVYAEVLILVIVQNAFPAPPPPLLTVGDVLCMSQVEALVPLVAILLTVPELVVLIVPIVFPPLLCTVMVPVDSFSILKVVPSIRVDTAGSLSVWLLLPVNMMREALPAVRVVVPPLVAMVVVLGGVVGSGVVLSSVAIWLVEKLVTSWSMVAAGRLVRVWS